MQSTFPSNNQHKQRTHHSVRNLIIAGVLLTLAFWVAINRQFVYDSVQFLTYQPSSDMAAVVNKSGMSSAGTFTFYATHPEIDNSEQFNKACDRKEQGTAILGCYTNDRIFIFNVTDARLNGIREVTAAHEMLHAVYQRLSDDERTQVNTLVEAEYKKLSDNPDFAERMAFYARTEPGERDNELHSIIGTEVAAIGPELEKHYAKYFADRQQVLTLFNGYNGVFTQIDQQAKQLSAQLDKLSQRIDADMASYKSQVKSLNEDITDFNRRAATAGSFSSQADFMNEQRALQRRVDEVNALRSSISSEVAEYEQLRLQYNQTITTSNNLYKSIDSSLAPAPSV